MTDALDDEWWIGQDEDKVSVQTEESSNETTSKAKKRKLVKKSEQEINDSEEHSSDESVTPRKKKKSDPKPKIASVESNPGKIQKKSKRKKISEALSKNKPAALSPKDLLEAMKTYFQGKLSPVELDEVQISDKQFCTCNDLTHTPTSFLKALAPKWKKMKSTMGQAPGSPLILIVTSAAIRATEFIRQIADFRGEDCKVGKLFAKHIKLEEQVKFLKKSVIHMGVGTPNRLHTLLAENSLHLDQVKYIVLDWSWRDVKLRRLIDIKEVKADLMKLLQTYVVPHVKDTKTKIGLL